MGYHHLIMEERCQIYALKSTGKTQKEIAQHLGVAPSTICRELKRNAGQKGGYRYKQANEKACTRRSEASAQPKCMLPTVVALIELRLEEKWSPEQISGRLKLDNILVSHERIYQHVWANKKAGGVIYKHLRHAGKKYHRRSSGKAGRGCIPGRVDIEKRPAIVETKTRLGDWEGDTIIGAKHQGALVSAVDRKSKFTKLAKVDRKTAKNVTQALKKCFQRIPCNAKRTMTLDNGKEFALHKTIRKQTGLRCYFAKPYCSWQRGLNEHTNGLVRQYFPKSTNLSKLTDQEVQFVEDQLNNRPRKVLGYKTPREVLFKIKRPPQIALQG